jgi:arylsulfatase A-like enzyme
MLACHTCYAAKPNILIVTVDDMSCDSVGVFGCELQGTTPHIDKLAQLGLRYHHAHVQTGSCYPCRNVLFSGRFSHNTAVEGFYQVKNTTYPHMVDSMKAGGYFVGIRGKVAHSTPYQPYGWDEDLTVIDAKKQHTKNPESYYRSTRKGIDSAAQAGKPFCLNISISDPHKPFYAMNGKGDIVNDSNVPSHIFKPEEVPIPGFLFDHPDVRLELAHYYSSVRRADDCLGQVMKALDESGKRIFKTATHGTITFRTMQKLAETDETIAARLKLLKYGVPEEFYDYENDPDALHNLIDDPRYADQIKQHRAAMLRFMRTPQNLVNLYYKSVGRGASFHEFGVNLAPEWAE